MGFWPSLVQHVQYSLASDEFCVLFLRTVLYGTTVFNAAVTGEFSSVVQRVLYTVRYVLYYAQYST